MPEGDFQSSSSSARSSSIRILSPECSPRNTRLLSDLYQSCNFFVVELECFKEAQQHDRKTMHDEIAMIEKNQTWQLVDCPKDREFIGVKWIFKTKFDQDGSIQKHKARLVT